MLRRIALLVALAAPLAALGQSSINVSPVPPYGKDECLGTTVTGLVLNWSMASGVTMPTGGTYRILVSTTDECPTTGTPTTIASDLAPDTSGGSSGLNNQRYPAVGDPASTFTVATLRTKTGASCLTNPIFYVCAQLMNGSTWVASTPTMQLNVESDPPPVPTNVSVSPGEGALTVRWADGPSTGVSAASYTASAYLLTCTDPLPSPIPRTCLDLSSAAAQATTSGKSVRLGGLAIGTRYGVEVIATSTTGLESAPSAIAVGTPINVFDYWETYVNDGGQEPGGCAAGSAGALSLLALAGLVRTLRRRS